ncbi:MAG: M50 family metallopeptidase [Candidatus Uhrbacteria bacterium]|nr:M50 family metallopeptidase [Candidatus Uhrbacteria bacterium]
MNLYQFFHKDHPSHKMRTRDWLWLLAYPLYQILGTLRHEGSHAIAAWLEGSHIEKFVFWPTTTHGFYWGYVVLREKMSWLTFAAPYLVDLLTFVLFFFICTKIKIKHHWIWVNLFIIGLILPFINSAYKYADSFIGSGDVNHIMTEIPKAVVHVYFMLTLLLYIGGLAWVQRSKKSVHNTSIT